MRSVAPRIPGWALVVFSGVALAAGRAVPVTAQSPEIRVDSVFVDVDGPTQPGCALSVMRDGSPVYERGYGMADLEQGIPITPRSVFHVASVSKHFTAMAVELLVNEGKVSWDDDVRTYVPEVPDFGETITLRHLVHHVSGIRDQWSLLRMAGWRWEADVVTQKDVLEITARQTALNFPVGSRYLYSNTGFTLLAVVVERVTGKTLREFTTERIFEPLGMEDTHFHDDHQMLVRRRAYAYEPDPEGTFGLKVSIPDFDVVGATSLFTTVHDLAAWDRNFYTGRVGGDQALERLHRRFVLTDGDTTDYAHGLSHGEYRGLRTVGHGGSDAGYRAQFLRFPEQSFTVAVLCNFPSADPGRRARRVADVYLADAFTEELGEGEEGAGAEEAAPDTSRAVTLTTEELGRVAGIYRAEPGNRLLRIELVGGDSLVADVGPGLALEPLERHRFRIVGAGVEIEYLPPTGDGPAGLRVPADEEDGTRYERTDPWEPAPDELRAFAGTYRSAELGTVYRFAVEEGELVFHHRKLESRSLTPAFTDAFELRGDTVVFTRDDDGRVDGFRISTGRVWNVRFDRGGETGEE